MTYSILYAAWTALYILTAALGFAQDAQGVGRFVMSALSIAFFVPGFLVLFKARAGKKLFHIRLVRGLSIASLSLSTALVALNVMSVNWSEQVGRALYALLAIISAPLACAGNWGTSLFLWACLLMLSMKKTEN